MWNLFASLPTQVNQTRRLARIARSDRSSARTAPVQRINPTNVVFSPPSSANGENGVGSRYGNTGTTETKRDSKPLKAPDVRDDALDAIGKTIGNIAENTNVKLTMPGSFGPLSLMNHPSSYDLTLHELGSNPLLKNLGERCDRIFYPSYPLGAPWAPMNP